MEEKKRKSSRTFELEKGGKRSFDLNKASARKFDLTKESDEINLEELKTEFLADGKIDAEEVNKLRDVLYADGKIDLEEADFIFELNDAVSGKKNDPTWNQFFVQVVSDFLLNDEKSPGVIDEEEGKWLVEKIGADGKVDGAEKQLLDHLKKNAKKMPATVTALLTSAVASDAAPSDGVNLQQLKKELIADGKIDAEEVNKLRDVLYADGKIDQEEADFVFDLNDAVSGKKNDPSWEQFFVQVISDYLLNDEKSPGVIDEEEGKWLIEKIGADGQVDGVEKQLLTNLKKNAKSMPSSVISLIDGGKNQPTPPNPVPPTPLPPDGEDESNGKWKKYAAILAGLAVLGGGGYYLSQQGDDAPQTVAEVVEGQNSDVAATDETTANQDGQSQEGDTSAADAANESPAGETPADSSPTENAPAVGGGSHSGDAPSNAAPSASEQMKKDATSPATGTKGTAPKANAPAKGTPSKPVDQPKASINSTSTGSGTSGTIEEEAINVIRGKYGNGDVRKRNLGGRYAEIQSKVNEMYRNGLVQ